MDYRKNDNLKPIKDCINQFLETGPIAKGMQKSALKEAWKEITGSTVHNRTKDIWQHDGKLLVRIESGPLKHFLLSNRTKLREKLKEKLPLIEIKEIVIL